MMVMSKILYVNDNLHQKLKFLATKLGMTMQEATDGAIEDWIGRRNRKRNSRSYC